MPPTCHQCTRRSVVMAELPDGRRFAYCLPCGARIAARFGHVGLFSTGPNNTFKLPA